MTFKKAAVVLTLSALFIPAAFADSGVSWRDGEAGGFEFHAMADQKNRAEVTQDLATTRSDPMTADGWEYVGGEVGFAPASPRYERIDNKWVRTDNMKRDTPKPSLTISAEERLRQQAIYFGS